MKTDKLFNVTLSESRLGVVKAESIEDAVAYIKKEYPNETIQSIEETIRKLLWKEAKY